MYQLIAENTKGEQLVLSNVNEYVITNIIGLDPPDSTVNVSERAGHDGATFNSAKVDMRTITITIAINSPAEVNRNKLYRFFQTSKRTRLYYFNELHQVYIDGWAQRAPVDFFAKKETMQITLVCPSPFWHGIAPVVGVTNGEESLFEFPFFINEGQPIPLSEYHSDNGAYIWNPGTMLSGLLIEIKATGSASNPQIWHANTDTFFKVNTSLQNGDRLVINTNVDEKAVTRFRGSSKTNLIASRDSESSWINAEAGNNVFVLSASSGLSNLVANITIITNLEGV